MKGLIDFKIATIILTFLTCNKPRPYSSKDLSQWINENNLHINKKVSSKTVARVIKSKKATGMTKDVKLICRKGRGTLYYIDD